MSKNEEVLESLKRYIRSAQGSGLNSVVQLPIEIALSDLNKNYDKDNSSVLIDEEVIKINEVIIKSALT